MSFIPKKLKDIFTRKAKTDKAAPAASARAEAPLPETTAPEVQQAFKAAQEKTPEASPKISPYAEKRLAALARFKNAEGHYQFGLEISQPDKTKGRNLFLVTSREADLYLALITAQPLAGISTMASSFKETLEKNTGLKNPGVFFRLRGSDYYIDGRDEFLALPPGPSFQLVIVPEGCEKQPPAPLPRKAPPESCALLRLPNPPPQQTLAPRKPAPKP